MALDVHIVSHTHWDREWYLPFARFRQRLVALIDELLDDPPAPGESFLLDGQAIVLEDYLGVRPDRAGALAALLGDGRLEAGPWYVLADELIPSGEALVRNLLAGRRVVRRLGATSPPVLYCPDSFGHPAILPALAVGFGLPLILVWRGYGGRRWPASDAARWRAPNGDEAVLFHLPRAGYELGSNLPVDAGAAAERWQRIRAELLARSSTGVTLVPHGADHHARQAGHRDALAALERAAGDEHVHRSSLTRFAARVVDRAGARTLPVVEGELRDSYGYTWTLQGTFATRAHEKRANAAAERALLREAEPWAALAARAGRSRRALLDEAWRTLLTTHPHDTLCGCSIDDVARGMEERQRAAMTQALGIRDDAIAELLGHDPVDARGTQEAWTPIVVVRNPAPRARSGVAIVEIEQWVRDVPVGPGSGAAAGAEPPAMPDLPRMPLVGRIQVVSRAFQYSRIESPRHYPDNDLVAVTRAAVWIAGAPPYGLLPVPIGRGRRHPEARPRPVRVTSNALDNGRLAVRVGAEGVVSLEDLDAGRVLAPLLSLEDMRDAGDLYTPAPRPRETRVEFRGARRALRGPLRGAIALRFRLRDTSARPARAIADVDVHLRLDAESNVLRVSIEGVNHGDDHRLRLLVHTGIARGATWADAAFGPLHREPVVVDDTDRAMETPPPTAPLHRYVSRFGDNAGVTVFSDGLAEYEARDDGGVAVTLVRAVGELSRNDIAERPGHAGWPAPTPGAECRGPFGAEFGILMHGARRPEVIDAIERAADDVLAPMRGATLRAALTVPPPIVGVELVGDGLAMSSVKETEDGAWIALRCVNLRPDAVRGRWRLPFALSEAHAARLDETVIGALIPEGDAVSFEAPPRGIVTILVR